MVEISILEEGREGDFYFLGGVLLSPPAPPTIVEMLRVNLIWKCPRPQVRQSIFQNKV